MDRRMVCRDERDNGVRFAHCRTLPAGSVSSLHESLRPWRAGSFSLSAVSIGVSSFTWRPRASEINGAADPVAGRTEAGSRTRQQRDRGHLAQPAVDAALTQVRVLISYPEQRSSPT